MLFRKKKTFAILLTLCFFLAQTILISPVFAESTGTNRLAGDDRYQTAIAISQKGWTTADYAILARGDDFADALCAGPLALKNNGPILLTESNTLNADTLRELKRLGVKHLIIIGGTGAVSQKVEDAVKAGGITEIERIYGSDRYETAVKIADKLGSSNQAILATGNDFPDALSISVVAAKQGIPILLTDQNSLPTSVSDYFNDKSISKTYLVGGAGVISTDIEKQVPKALRLAGNNRYETNVAIVKNFESSFDFNSIYVATGGGLKGDQFADALTGAVLAAKDSSPLFLMDQVIPQITADYLKTKILLSSKATGLGGASVVPSAILSSILGYKNGITVSAKYDKAGIYGPETTSTTISGDVIICAADVTLRNTIIEGDLLLSQTIGDGTVNLKDVTVKGKTIVNGGGPNSIIMYNFNGQTVVVDIPDGSYVRLVAQGSTSVNDVSMGSNGTLQESDLTGAGFINVEIPAGAQVTLSGTFSQVDVDAAGANITLPDGSSITTLNVNAPSYISGTGQITNANVNTNGVVIEQKPENITLAKDVDAIINNTLESGTKTPSSPPQGGGGGGGDGVVASDIAVASANDSGINDSAAYKGVTATFILGGADIAKVKSIKVELLDAEDNLLATNILKSHKFPVSAGNLTAPIVAIEGTYAHGSWTTEWTEGNPDPLTPPSYVKMTLTDEKGVTYSAQENSIHTIYSGGKTWSQLWAVSYNGPVSGQITANESGEVNGTLNFQGTNDLIIVGTVTGTGNLTTFEGTVSGSIEGAIVAQMNANGIDTLSGIITPSSGVAEGTIRIIGIFGQTGIDGDFAGQIITGPVPTYVDSMEITSEAGSTVKAGETLQLLVDVTPEEASDEVAWSVYVNDREKGSIDENGLFTATSEGTVTVIVKALDGSLKDDTFVVTVEPSDVGLLTRVNASQLRITEENQAEDTIGDLLTEYFGLTATGDTLTEITSLFWFNNYHYQNKFTFASLEAVDAALDAVENEYDKIIATFQGLAGGYDTNVEALESFIASAARLAGTSLGDQTVADEIQELAPMYAAGYIDNSNTIRADIAEIVNAIPNDSEINTLAEFFGLVNEALSQVKTPEESGYTFDVSSGKITGYTGEENNLVIPGSFMVEGVIAPVKAIEYNAFYGKTSLTSVVMPETLEVMYRNAFDGCTNLESVDLGTNIKEIYNYAFSRCTSLTSIIIPDSVTTLDHHAFYGCTSLETVTIGSGVSYLTNSLFEGCSSLNNVVIPNKVNLLGIDTFKDCVALDTLTIEGNVKGTNGGAFSGCTNLTTVIIGSDVTVLGNYLFQHHSALSAISIPDGVSEIGFAAFQGTGLTEVVIPNSVTTLGNYVFQECVELTDVTIGSGLEAIPGWAFTKCSSLQEITLPSNVTSIGQNAFADYSCYEADQEPVTKITLGSDVNIYDYIYYNESRNTLKSTYETDGSEAGTYEYAEGSWSKVEE